MQPKYSQDVAKHIEATKAQFEAAKHLTTLNAGSIVVIGTFISDIFPHDGGELSTGLGVKLLIAGAFLLFSFSLVLAAFGLNAFSFSIWSGKSDYRSVSVNSTHDLNFLAAPWLFFAGGLACFGLAVLTTIF